MLYIILFFQIAVIIGLVIYARALITQRNALITIAKDSVSSNPLPRDDTRFRVLLDNLPDYVLEFDSKLSLVFANKSANTLVKEMDLQLLDQIGDQLTLSKTLMRVWFRELFHVIKYNEPRIFEFKSTVSDELRHYEVNAVPDHGDNGEDSFVLCVIRDITTRKSSEEQQRRLDLERQRRVDVRQLSEHIAHEIRNPLSVIGTSIYLLSKTNEESKRAYHTDKVHIHIQHITKLLDSMLLMNQLDADVTITRNDINLTLFIEQLGRKFQQLAIAKQITVEIDIQKLPIIQVELQYLRQALEHILYNALGYTDEGGAIKVTAIAENEHILIEVRDSGQGMTSEELTHIFDRFYRCDPSRPRNAFTGGSGLGLSITKAIIERHGGKIHVQSEYGIGSVFAVELPINRKTTDEPNLHQYTDKREVING